MTRPLWQRKGYDPKTRRDFARDATVGMSAAEKADFWTARLEDGLISKEQYIEELQAAPASPTRST